jgi:hypothetical protein
MLNVVGMRFHFADGAHFADDADGARFADADSADSYCRFPEDGSLSNFAADYSTNVVNGAGWIRRYAQ